MGGGGSGLAAAVSGAEEGLDVLLLEKMPFLGGTTGIAVGSFTACGTSLQTRAGLTDEVSAHAEDVARFARPEDEAANNEPLRRFFLSQAADTYEWLRSLGLNFHGPSPEPPNRVSRMHNVIPNAKAYIATLQSRLLALGGEIVCGARVARIIKSGNRVVGLEVVIDDRSCEVRSRRGIVLAAGDYANSDERIRRHKGERFANIEGINPHALGDGHRLAEEAGGQLVNMGITWGPELRFVPPRKEPFTNLLPAEGILARLGGRLLPWVPQVFINRVIKRLLVTWQHPDDKIFESGAILVNSHGERFCDERCFPDREIAVSKQPGKVAYVLFDQRLADLYSKWPHFVSTAPEIAYAYVRDYLKLRPDIAVLGETLEIIAKIRDLPGEAIVNAVGCFNRYTAGDVIDAFGRTGDHHPLSGKRWVLFGPVKSYFTITEGGAAINEDMQVLDIAGEPVDGLYAVGCNGLGGQILMGHGLHIAWAMTSGRLAGKTVAGIGADS